MRTAALIALYVLSAAGLYGVIALEGAAGPVNWWGVAVWVVLLWFVARGSRVAWGITLALTVLGTLSLAFIGMDLSAATVGVIVLLALQLTALIALRPVGARRPLTDH